MNGFTGAGWLLMALGSAVLYAGARHQAWLVRPWPARASRTAGGLLLAVAFVLLLHGLQALTAVFVYVTALMLFFVLWPYVGAALRLRRGAADRAEPR